MITKPTLPPRKGYVEVEVNGKRTYRNAETGVLIENEHNVIIPEPGPEESIDERMTALETAIADGLTLYEEDLGDG